MVYITMALKTLFGSMSKSAKSVAVPEVSLAENVEIHLQA